MIGFPIHIILCYLFIFIFLPKLFQGKIIEFFSYLALSLGITLILKFELTYYFINTDVLPEFAGITSKITFDYAIQTILGEVYVITFVTAIKLIIDWMKQRDLLAKNNKILLENELKYLRSQIQPHFFFNTLNNLYSLAIDKSEKTVKEATPLNIENKAPLKSPVATAPISINGDDEIIEMIYVLIENCNLYFAKHENLS